MWFPTKKKKKQVLVVPSCLPPFAQEMEGVACVNPGFAVDSGAYGTVALLTLHYAPDSRPTIERTEIQILRL